MDDLNDKLAKLLADPAAMDKIGAALSSLTGEDKPAAPPPPPPATGNLPDMTMLAKLAPLVSSLKQDDNDTRLLAALKPYLHGAREQRLDEAMQLLKLSKLLPLLQGSLGGDKNGG